MERLNLPAKALVSRRIPKNKFYEKLQAGKSLKTKFIRQIDHIVWKYKLSQDTINISPAKDVEEIQVFEVHLKEKNLAKEVLDCIDRAIPYPIVFVLIHQDEYQLAVAYKQRSRQHEDRAVVDSYFFSEWQDESGKPFKLLKGLDLHAVYENIIRQLMPLQQGRSTDLQESIDKQKQAQALQRDISLLEAKIRKEKQFNRKVDYNLKLQEKQNELEKIIPNLKGAENVG